MNRLFNVFVFLTMFYASHAGAFTIDMPNSEAINSLGYYNVSNMKVGEFGYLAPEGFSVCKKNGELMINGFSILQRKMGDLFYYYKLYKKDEGIDVYFSGGSLGYMTYRIIATKITVAKECKFTFELNKFPLIKVNRIFGTDNLSSLIKKSNAEKRKELK